MASWTGTEETGFSLQGHLLVAAPRLDDPHFAKSVVFVCQHSREGAMGLIINRRLPTLSLSEILKQMEIAVTTATPRLPVYYGGPVEPGRGFLLHSADYGTDNSVRLSQTVSLTSHPDVLRDLAAGRGPERVIFALGYAGWAPEQLEHEIYEDDWFTLPADEAMLFETGDADKWSLAYTLLGMDPSRLQGFSGHA